MGKKKRGKDKKKAGKGNVNKEASLLLAEDTSGVAPEAGILDRLSSSSAGQRATACAALGVHLFQVSSDKAPLVCRLLADQGMLRRLVALLRDGDDEVTLTASKALRNYCLVGHRVGCELLVTADNKLLTNLRELCAPSRQKSPDLLACVFAILASLSTHVLDVVEQATQDDILQCAFKALESAACATSFSGDARPAALLSVEVANFLFVASEDNPPLAALLLNTSGLIPKVVVGLMQNTNALDSLRSACAGILANVVASSGDHMNQATQTELLNLILATAGQALQIDVVAQASAMIATLKDQKLEHEKAMSAKQGDDPNNPDAAPGQGITQTEWGKITEESVFTWKQSAVCVVQVLEILTNLTTSESLLSHTEVLIKEAVLPKLEQQASLGAGAESRPSEAVMTEQCRLVLSPEETAVVSDFISQTQRTAVTCMSNLILTLPSSMTGDLSGVLTQAFARIQRLEAAYGQSQPSAIKEMDSLTSLIWQVVRKQAPTKDHLQTLLDIARSSKSHHISVNVAGALGVIGTQKEHFPNNFVIGSVLIGMLQSVDKLDVACETVNSLIDVYTEDNVHSQQVKQLQLISKLAASLPIIEKLARAHPHQDDSQLLERAHETLENIDAFVNYKPAHI